MPHLKPIYVSLIVFRRFGSRASGSSGSLSLEEALGLHGEVDLVLEARVLALRQQLGIVGDDVAQRLDPRPLALGEIVQHVGVHQLLDARMTDADAHAAIVVADMRA